MEEVCYNTISKLKDKEKDIWELVQEITIFYVREKTIQLAVPAQSR